MDAKITLSFNADVIHKAKRFADKNNMSLSRLTEFLFAQITSGNYQSLEDLPVADWVHTVAEGEATYNTKTQSKKALREAYFETKK
ncbi:MAG: DUF6364 family protein [Bacteroidia bacterium]|jgi:hypothetical protein